MSEDRKRYGLVLEASVRREPDAGHAAPLRARACCSTTRAREREARAQVDALRIKAARPATPLVNQLSGGNQQKVVLGKWLLATPRVLFLDEPTRGIDVGAKAEIYQPHRASSPAAGLAVVLVSSDLPEVLGLSHRVLVLSQGRPTATLDAREQPTPEA